MQFARATTDRRTVLKRLGIGLAGVSISCASTGAAQQPRFTWPMFGQNRGNTRYSPETTGPVETAHLKWSVETGLSVPSSPAIVDGTVYIGTGDGTIYALAVDDGTEQWSYKAGDSVASSPLVNNETVYVGSRDSKVYALSTIDGSEQWTYETGGGVFSSPTLVDGTVIIGSRDGTVYGLSATDGSTEWTYSTNGEIWSSPAVVDGTVYIGSRDTHLYALSAKDGTERWRFTTGGWVESSPAVQDGTVYVGSLDKRVYALSATDGTEQWSVQVSDVVASSPAIADETVFVGSRDNRVYALSTVDGTQQWRYETSGRVFSSPAVGRETLYVGSADNRIYALSTDGGTERWSFETDNGVFSSPALIDGTVIVGSSDGNIYALSESTETGGPGLVLPSTVVGALGLGGGAWWVYRNRDSSEHDSDNNDNNASADSPTATAATGSKRTSRSNDNSPVAERSKPATEQMATTSQPASHSMVPNEIPSTSAMPIEYNAITQQTPIGSGGNADVSRAVVSRDGGEVPIAIKEPRMSGTIHVETIEGLLDEAKTWAEMDDHDHIVDVLDYGSEPIPWIAMEYMDGGDLSDRIDTIDTDEVIWIALTVTKAVHHAHRHGVAHLDLKPENILFRSVTDAWDVPKVSDWGLAKELLDHSKTVDGLSPQYAAPEQFSDEYGPSDDITDVYQLGTVFYELLTGRPPFEGSSGEIMRRVLTEDPTPPSEIADIPPALDEILLTALAKSKDERYDSLIYLRDGLQDVFENEIL